MLTSYLDNYKGYINTLLSLSFIGFIFYGWMQFILINLMGYFYLLFNSVQLLEGSNTIGLSRNDRHQALLKLWVSYGTFTVFDTYVTLLFDYLPFYTFYNLIKMLVLIWLLVSPDNYETMYDFIVGYVFTDLYESLEQLNLWLEEIVIKMRNLLD